MATKSAFKRVGSQLRRNATNVKPLTLTFSLQLTREYQNIQKTPPPFITAHPSETNILE